VEDPRRQADEEIQGALKTLEQRITERVRVEQLRDRLTNLPNEAALNAVLSERVAQRKDFWAAFIEIDQFKWINDQHGYQNADALLQKVAEALNSACSYFLGSTSAFRPHGDEFYMIGDWGEASDLEVDQLAQCFEHVRRNIAALRVTCDTGVVTCTVCIGWLHTRTLLAEQSIVITERAILSRLEQAVAEAKWTKDCVIQYSLHLTDDDVVTVRSECAVCQCKFQVNARRSRYDQSELWRCPNCGTEGKRPPKTVLVPAPTPATV
jgi:diguanylate cyclase (GGDEF)-like protein